jgi:protein-disulfide isomerase
MPGRLKNAVDVLATTLLIITSGLFVWTQIDNRWLRARPRPQIETVKNLSINASAIRHARGSGSVVLVEFTDYECPFCGQYARQTAPSVERQLVDTGLLRNVVFNFPLEQMHRHAKRASEAAECAGQQGRYWEMHSRLFSDVSNLDYEALINAGKELGLDEHRFIRCLSGEATQSITADIGEGMRLGVKVTPTFFVGVVRRGCPGSC